MVFLGDYLDSYDRSADDCVKTLQTVLYAIEDGKAVGLRGNHEMSYLEDGMQCSGFRADTLVQVTHMQTELLKDYHWCEGFLLSHAGVSQSLLENREETLEEYLARGVYTQIGSIRGGRNPVGGLWWCDWRYEFEPVPGVKQIVGHTRGHDIREKDGNYCIDCLDFTDPKGLLIKDGTARTVYLNDLTKKSELFV